LKRKIDTLLIDYGNTLVFDPFLQILEMKSNEFQEMLAEKKYKIEWKSLAKSWIIVNSKIALPYISHFYQEDIIVTRALENAGISESDLPILCRKFLDTYRQGFREILTQDLRRVEVEQTIAFLKKKGLKLGVSSNETELALNVALSYYGIINLFDLILSSEKAKAEKPDTKFFHYALDLLDSKPQTSAHVGDDPIRDILPVKKIGMSAILYIPPPAHCLETSWRSYRIQKISPDLVINKFDELRQIV
jgi:HAD superfamily hydrolase (TIGR01549 family)